MDYIFILTLSCLCILQINAFMRIWKRDYFFDNHPCLTLKEAQGIGPDRHQRLCTIQYIPPNFQPPQVYNYGFSNNMPSSPLDVPGYQYTPSNPTPNSGYPSMNFPSQNIPVVNNVPIPTNVGIYGQPISTTASSVTLVPDTTSSVPDLATVTFFSTSTEVVSTSISSTETLLPNIPLIPSSIPTSNSPNPGIPSSPFDSSAPVILPTSDSSTTGPQGPVFSSIPSDLPAISSTIKDVPFIPSTSSPISTIPLFSSDSSPIRPALPLIASESAVSAALPVPATHPLPSDSSPIGLPLPATLTIPSETTIASTSEKTLSDISQSGGLAPSIDSGSPFSTLLQGDQSSIINRPSLIGSPSETASNVIPSSGTISTGNPISNSLALDTSLVNSGSIDLNSLNQRGVKLKQPTNSSDGTNILCPKGYQLFPSLNLCISNIQESNLVQNSQELKQPQGSQKVTSSSTPNLVKSPIKEHLTTTISPPNDKLSKPNKPDMLTKPSITIKPINSIIPISSQIQPVQNSVTQSNKNPIIIPDVEIIKNMIKTQIIDKPQLENPQISTTTISQQIQNSSKLNASLLLKDQSIKTRGDLLSPKPSQNGIPTCPSGQVLNTIMNICVLAFAAPVPNKPINTFLLPTAQTGIKNADIPIKPVNTLPLPMGNTADITNKPVNTILLPTLQTGNTLPPPTKLTGSTISDSQVNNRPAKLPSSEGVISSEGVVPTFVLNQDTPSINSINVDALSIGLEDDPKPKLEQTKLDKFQNPNNIINPLPVNKNCIPGFINFSPFQNCMPIAKARILQRRLNIPSVHK